ncbi:hypothetical protein DN752_23465 [Echinicola strongylocentroti]|uniref:FecR family protein n=1 Tax=Echinicola strongylocentroti TaxID=1795355 RepID=A0A2Z4IQ15_9BACT|nr:FecR domain-containing protein [Echinicola strongylocentroti]AWW32860.1 hypothetical protein DN752_23465 [Echinicola strongylocentroti]
MIDYLLIWKKAHNCISDAEEKQLEEWISEDPRHETYYLKTLRFYESQKIFVPIDPNKASSKIKERITFQKARPLPYWRYAAALVIFLASAAVIWWSISSTVQYKDIQEEVLIEVSQQTGSVRLYTSTGSQIDFENDSVFSIADPNAKISAKGKKLEYTDAPTSSGIRQLNTLVVPRGESFTLSLADGTKVWLNSESIIKYPSSFGEKTREIEFTGEGYFEVAKDASRPFVLQSQSQTIKVLGTAFNLTSYKDEDSITTTLVEGSVALETSTGKDMVLHPNDQARLSRTNGRLIKKEVDVENFIAWKDGVMYFDNEELQVILSRMARWYDIKAVFENESLKTQRFTGEIVRYEEISQFLAMLEASGIVEFKIKDNVVIVK